MLLSFLKNIFTTPVGPEARATYIALVGRARNSFFYESLGVPDTLDGRFELVLLHLFLFQHRLLAAAPTDAPQAQAFSRQLGELFFEDMDRSLREIGVADTGVRYRIKAMAKAYHGRLQVYGAALEAGREALKGALVRNLYGTVAEGSLTQLEAMAEYVERMAQDLGAMPLDALYAAQLPAEIPAMAA